MNRSCQIVADIARSGHRGSTQQAYEAGVCQGFVVGVLDSISTESLDTSKLALPRLCLPSNLDQHTATEIVARYLDSHPEQRQIAAYTLVRRALASAFPCKP